MIWNSWKSEMQCSPSEETDRTEHLRKNAFVGYSCVCSTFVVEQVEEFGADKS